MFEISKQSSAAGQADLADIRFYLLARPEVQEDLAVSTNQLARIKQTYRTPYKEIPELNEFITNQKEKRNAVPEDHRREHNLQSARGIAKLFGNYAQAQLEDILASEQRQRLDQLVLQTRGPVLILVQTRLASALAITPEQMKELSAQVREADQEIIPDLQKFGRGFISGYGPGETEELRERKMKKMIKRLRRLIRERDCKILDTLSGEQRKKWFELHGKALKIDWDPWDLIKTPFEKENS